MNKVEWWYHNYQLLVKYKEEHGNVDIPYNYEIDGFKLGIWVANQKGAYNGKSFYTLTDEKIKKLNKYNIDWSKKDTKILTEEVKDYNNYKLTLYKRLSYVLRDLQIENINEINDCDCQKEIEKVIIKRIFK